MKTGHANSASYEPTPNRSQYPKGKTEKAPIGSLAWHLESRPYNKIPNPKVQANIDSLEHEFKPKSGKHWPLITQENEKSGKPMEKKHSRGQRHNIATFGFSAS